MSPVRTLRSTLTRSVVVALALTVALLMPAGVARAQMMGNGRFMDPPVDSKEIDALIKLAKIDGETETAINDLFQGFQAQFEEAKTKLQEIFRLAQEEAQKTQDMSVWQDAQKKALEYYQHQLKLRDNLFNDIKLLLTEDQAAQWPAFERLSRRNHVMDTGQNVIAGSSVDLVKLVDDTKTDSEAAVSPEVADVITRYELELDNQLVEIRDLQTEQLEQVSKILGEGGNFMTNMQDWEKMFDESRALQAKVRETNVKYARQIAGLLADDQRAKFDLEYNRRANPRVFAATYVDQGFDTALGLESITPDQKEKIIVIREEYEREAAPIRAKWDEELVKWQSNVKMMEMFMGAQAGGNAESKAAEASKKELDERYYVRIREVLTEEQVKALPDRSASDWRKSNTFENP